MQWLDYFGYKAKVYFIQELRTTSIVYTPLVCDISL